MNTVPWQSSTENTGVDKFLWLSHCLQINHFSAVKSFVDLVKLLSSYIKHFLMYLCVDARPAVTGDDSFGIILLLIFSLWLKTLETQSLALLKKLLSYLHDISPFNNKIISFWRVHNTKLGVRNLGSKKDCQEIKSVDLWNPVIF